MLPTTFRLLARNLRKVRVVYSKEFAGEYANVHRPVTIPLLSLSLRSKHTSTTGTRSVVTQAATKAVDTTPIHLPKRITSVSLEPNDRFLSVKWTDEEHDKFPYVWLRDNCQCPRCYRQATHSRQLTMTDLDVGTNPVSAQVTDTGATVRLTWPDGHQSSFDASWLSMRAFNPGALQRRRQMYRGPVTLWGADDFKSGSRVPKVEFENLLTSEKNLLSWLEDLERFGLTVVTNVPATNGQVKKLAERIDFLKQHIHGSEPELVSAIPYKLPSDSNEEVTPDHCLHTDLVCYEYMPGIQFLNCIKTGGANHLVDGFYVARQLRRLHPRAFHLLSSVPVDFHDIGVDVVPYYKIHRAPIIQLNKNGEPERINFNNQVRDSYLNVDLELVTPLYEAMHLFNDICNDANRNRATVNLQQGDMLVFDNMRVLHAWETPSEATERKRHLESGYMDWEDVRSKMRVLRCKLEGTNELLPSRNI